MLYPLILGLGRIETTEPLRYNGVFHYLAGLPGYPDASTLRRFLDRFARRGQNAFLKLHDTWRAAMFGQPTQAIFDLDSTVLTVYGRQERAQVAYNPKKRGRPSYLPLLCLEGNTQDCWEGSYHPGATHVSTITIPLLERAFPKLPDSIREVRVRADAAFFDHKIIEFIEAKRAFYAIVARLTRPLKSRLSGLRYRRVSPGVWAGEFRYCPQGWLGPRRFVVIRRPVPEEPSAQYPKRMHKLLCLLRICMHLNQKRSKHTPGNHRWNQSKPVRLRACPKKPAALWAPGQFSVADRIVSSDRAWVLRQSLCTETPPELAGSPFDSLENGPLPPPI